MTGGIKDRRYEKKCGICQGELKTEGRRKSADILGGIKDWVANLV